MRKDRSQGSPNPLVWIGTDTGTVDGYGYSRVEGAGSYREATRNVGEGIEWTCEPDSEDEVLRVEVEIADYLELVRKARAYDQLIGSQVHK